VLNNVPMGSLLIQSNSKDGEPLLLQVKLPVHLRTRTSAEDAWVFLLDAQVREPSSGEYPYSRVVDWYRRGSIYG